MENDLISRSALWTDIMMIPHNGDIIFSSDVEEAIKDAPAIDAVPVVRCKDCNRFMPYTEAHRKASGFDGDCAFLAGYADCDRECVHEMDFCSKGARMDGKEDTNEHQTD